MTSLQPTSPQRRSFRFTIGASAILFLLVLNVYRSALDGVFLFDDLNNIVENRSVANGIFDPGNWKSTRPLTQMSFAANYSWSQLDPISYHWTNHIIHAIAGIFLFLWLRETFARLLATRPDDDVPDGELIDPTDSAAIASRRASMFALMIALIWAVHPINTQAVTYIVQRGESMMGLFFFAFLYFVARSYELGTGRVSLVFQCLSLVALLGGLGSKQVMLTAIPLGLLYARLFYAVSWREAFLRCRWLWLGAIGLLVLGGIAVLPIVLGGNAGVGFQITQVTPLEYARTQPEVILHYVRLVFWPSPLILDHGWPPQKDPVKIVLATALLLGGLAFCLRSLARGSRLAFFPIAALLVLLPTSSVIPLQDLAFEHRMYVPAAMMLAFLFGVLLKASSTSLVTDYRVIALSILVVAVASWMTHTRNRDYHSVIGMWEDVVAKTIGAGHEHLLAGRLYNNLGNAYADEQEWDKSLAALEKAVEQGTFSGPTYANLARGYLAKGQLKKAKTATLNAIELQPTNARVRQQLGLIAVQSGNVPEALEHFLAASQLAPNDHVIMSNVAQAYLEQGQLTEAEAWLDRVVELDPDNREARKKRMLLIAQQGELEQAEKLLTDYVAQYPDDAIAYLSLAKVQLGRSAEIPQGEDKAIDNLKKCIELPESPKGAHFLIANVYRQRGELELAKSHYEKETLVDPRNADAWNNLAGLMVTQDPAGAIECFERVLKIAPDYHQADYNIAAVQASNGQIELAIERLRNLLSRTEFPPARQLLEKIQTLLASPR